MSIKYLFFADGELRVFISELVAKQYCQDGEHHFYTFHPAIQETWDLFPWHSKTLLPWIHKEGASAFEKYVGLRKRIHHILQTVADQCVGADEIYIHTFQIYSERINYLFKYLQARYPQAKIRARLIPDGSLNLTRRPMSGVRSLPALINTVRWAFDPDINYYIYRGDRLGADADITDRIYLPRGFPHEYDPQRVYWLDMPNSDPAKRDTEETALVVGTALTQTGVCSVKDMQLAAAGIQRFLRQQGIQNIWYKPHHKERLDQLELSSEGYQLMTTKKGIERLILEQHYDHLIGMCSSALLNAKLMYPNLKVTSCGLDLLEKRLRKGASAQKYRQACQNLNIELLPVLSENHDTSSRRAA